MKRSAGIRRKGSVMADADSAEAAEGLADLTVLVPPGAQPGSLSAIAYYRIRDLLVTLELAPGTVLAERDLMERLQVGRTPVREAVRRLADEGLVTVLARRGTVVAGVDIRDLQHVSEVRVGLEGLSARLAAERADDRDRGDAARLLADLDGPSGPDPSTPRVPPPADSRRAEVRSLIRMDQRVHHCVHRASHNRYLQETAGKYFTLSLRLWFLGLERVRRLDEAVTEHRDVLAAVLEGDAGAAEDAARAHVTGFWQEMHRVLTR